jgi:hypothetical protein
MGVGGGGVGGTGRHHALQVACEGLSTASDGDKAYIGALVGSLEQDKQELLDNNFNPEDRETAYVRLPLAPFQSLHRLLRSQKGKHFRHGP